QQGKKSEKQEKRSIPLPMEFSETFFSDDENDEADTTNTSTWIIFWALNYQARCTLSDIETGFLIKFLRYLCIFHNENKYATFPTTLKMARKALGICAHMIKYTTYFSNHPIANKRQPCTLPIAKKVPVT
ncbi:12691_t:CDS:2, partial [Gigaspora rosea]